MSKSQTEKLFNLIPKLDAVEFVGLARVLKVRLMDETNPDAENVKDKYTPRAFSDVLEELLQNFEAQSRNRRREIIQVLKAATKKAKKGEEDASNTEDS